MDVVVPTIMNSHNTTRVDMTEHGPMLDSITGIYKSMHMSQVYTSLCTSLYKSIHIHKSVQVSTILYVVDFGSFETSGPVLVF